MLYVVIFVVLHIYRYVSAHCSCV